MKKEIITFTALIALLSAGIYFKVLTGQLQHLAYFFLGVLTWLLISVTIGRWQAKKAGERIDTMIRQKKGN